jgi:putative hydrolase
MRRMADDDAPGPGGAGGGFPDFSALPMFGDLAKALAGQGPLNWDAARQFAQLAATGGTSETNVEPTLRIAYERLLPIVDLHVRDVTGSDSNAATPSLDLVTPGVWAHRTLEAYRPLFDRLAVSLGQMTGDDQPAAADPMASIFAGLSKMLGPSMMGMAIGSMVGRLSTRAFGQFDLPIPRNTTSVEIIPSSVESFATAWELPSDEMRLWVVAQELISATVYRHEHARAAITELVRRHVGAFRPDPSAVADRLATLDVDTDNPFESIQRAMSDPEVMLGAVRSEGQIELAPVLDAAIAAVVGYVDYMVDSVAVRLIGGEALRIAEAVRRRRIDAGAEDLFVERLLGLQLTAAQVQRGKVFVGGVVDRAGEPALSALFDRADGLPTPAEIDAPGLWLARLDLSS